MPQREEKNDEDQDEERTMARRTRRGENYGEEDEERREQCRGEERTTTRTRTRRELWQGGRRENKDEESQFTRARMKRGRVQVELSRREGGQGNLQQLRRATTALLLATGSFGTVPSPLPSRLI